jgi:hypothetical protein
LNAALVQLGIAVFGLSALFMAMGNVPLFRKWAPIVGLVGQVFWAMYAISVGAWGIGLLVLAYTAVYIYGVWVQWWKPA